MYATPWIHLTSYVIYLQLTHVKFLYNTVTFIAIYSCKKDSLVKCQ